MYVWYKKKLLLLLQILPKKKTTNQTKVHTTQHKREYISQTSNPGLLFFSYYESIVIARQCSTFTQRRIRIRETEEEWVSAKQSAQKKQLLRLFVCDEWQDYCYWFVTSQRKRYEILAESQHMLHEFMIATAQYVSLFFSIKQSLLFIANCG